MKLIFVHGWSVTNTETYGEMPSALNLHAPPELDLRIEHLYLAKYVTFSDEVVMDDLARGMEAAVQSEVLPRLRKGERFACITHSTGGPVVRAWIAQFYGNRLRDCPLSRLVMLAPANHGSALAQLGKGKLSRMKFFLNGVQPGVGVLNWLELGSDQSWDLNSAWMNLDLVGSGIYTFVLTGQSIDRSFYDHLNSYTGEAGSDGVVRVAAANMNCGLLRLEQQNGRFKLTKEGVAQASALGVLPGLSHSGEHMGIMRSVRKNDTKAHPTVAATIQCLTVATAAQYKKCMAALADLTVATQKAERVKKEKDVFLVRRRFETNRYLMLVFRVQDDRGNKLTDYDILFTAGPEYNENHLPEGFFVDRQRNSKSPGKLAYYLNYDVMEQEFSKGRLEDKFGFKIAARPSDGYAHYAVAEHRGRYSSLAKYFQPNQTVMIDVVLGRKVAQGVFQLTQSLVPEDFRKQPHGDSIP